MLKEKLSQINKRKVLFTFLVIILTYILLLVFLKLLIDKGPSLCIFKLIFKRDCPGCGMTRAFYHMLKLDINSAIKQNNRVIIAYPFIWGTYISYVWKKLNIIERKICHG